MMLLNDCWTIPASLIVSPRRPLNVCALSLMQTKANHSPWKQVRQHICTLGGNQMPESSNAPIFTSKFLKRSWADMCQITGQMTSKNLREIKKKLDDKQAKLFYQKQPKFIKRQELMRRWRAANNAKQFSVHILWIDFLYYTICTPALHLLIAVSAPWQCYLMSIKLGSFSSSTASDFASSN